MKEKIEATFLDDAVQGICRTLQCAEADVLQQLAFRPYGKNTHISALKLAVLLLKRQLELEANLLAIRNGDEVAVAAGLAFLERTVFSPAEQRFRDIQNDSNLTLWEHALGLSLQ